LKRLLITGAGGRIGRSLRAGLAGRYALVLVDRVAEPRPAPTEALTLDLAGLTAAERAVAGVEAIVHLAAESSSEASLDSVLRDNVLVTYNVFEAARRAGVRRAVFASTSRVTGFYPETGTVRPDSPPRPDGHYAVSKALGEQLARLYSERHGLEVACLRIGTFAERPTEPRHLSTWLSPRDCLQLVRCCLDLPELGFLVVYGTSANTRRRYAVDGWDRLGYRPLDDAEEFADEVAAGSTGIGRGS
jgi:uronate dehydrogenase